MFCFNLDDWIVPGVGEEVKKALRIDRDEVYEFRSEDCVLVVFDCLSSVFKELLADELVLAWFAVKG